MKLLDKIVEKLVEEALNKSDLLIELTKTIESIAFQIEKSAKTMVQVTQQLNVHHNLIKDLYDRQEMLATAIKRDSINIEMSQTKEKPVKPN
jgi:hypothetical protein